MARPPSRRPAKGPSQRQLRVGELIRHLLAEILTREDLRDPVLSGVPITVTEVSVSPDLKNVVVYCTPLGGREASAVVAALNRHSGYLRGALGRALTLRYTPALSFRYDTAFERAEAVAALFQNPEVRADLDRSAAAAEPAGAQKDEADGA